MPAVSVIITTYNGTRFIGEALHSVLAQSFRDYELLVVDDGSSEDIQETLEPYREHYRYIRQEHAERSAARNNGARQACGEWIAYLDDDDIWLPEKIATQMACVQRFPSAVMAHGAAQIVDADANPVSWWGLSTIGSTEGDIELYTPGPEILNGSSINPSIALLRRDALLQAGGFDLSIHKGEDWDCWIRLAGLGPFVKIPQVLAKYRTYGIERELKKRASEYYLERSLYIIRKNANTDPARFPEVIAGKASANIYLQAALAHIQLGNSAEGHRRLAEALRIDPELAAREKMAATLEHVCRRIWKDSGQIEQVKCFLTAFYNSAPAFVTETLPPRRKILARMYLADAFRAYDQGESSSARQALLPGLMLDPAWLFNRGVLSITFKTFWRR